MGFVSAVIAIGIAIYTLWVTIGSFARGLMGKTMFFAVATYYSTMPAAFALTMDNRKWFEELGKGIVLRMLAFMLLCMLGFHAGYGLSRRNAFRELPRRLYQPNEWVTMVVCIVLWAVGIIGAGGLSLGMAWETDWLASASVSGQASYGVSGYANAVVQACLVIGPLAMIWAPRSIMFLLSPLVLMQVLFAVANGGRWVLVSTLMPMAVRLILKYIDSRRREEVSSRSALSSVGTRFKILSLVLVGVTAGGFVFSLIGYLRLNRQQSLLATLTSGETYTSFSTYQQDRPWYLSWADGVWVYPYNVMQDVPGAVPVQPWRIAGDVGSALIPGYRRVFGDRDVIEQDLAQLYFGSTTFRGATVHPTMFGILFIFGGWFGIAVTPFLGMMFRKIDDAMIRGRGFRSGLFWTGTIATACYWCMFFGRGALQFAMFRAFWAFGLWVIISAVIRMLAGTYTTELREDDQQPLLGMKYGIRS